MKKWPYLLLALTCSMSALKDVLVALQLRSLPPTTVTFLISVISTAYAAVALGARLRLQRPQWASRGSRRAALVRLGALSLCTGLALSGSVLGVKLGGPVLYTLVDNTAYPLYVAVLAWLFLGEALRRPTIVAFCLGLVGLVLFQASGLDLSTLRWNWGAGITLLSSLLFAVCLNLIKSLLGRGVAPEVILFARFLVADLFLLVLLAATHALHGLRAVGPVVALIALGGYAVPFQLSFYALRRVPATVFGLFFVGVPVLSYVFTATLIPQTRFGWPQIAGGLVVVTGLLVGVIGSSRAAAREREVAEVAEAVTS